MTDPRVTPARPDLAARHLEGTVSAGRFADGVRRRVITARTPVRNKPDTEAPYTSELLFGETFTVYDSADGWAWGQAARDGYVGYVPAATLGDSPEPGHWLAVPASHFYPAPDLKLPPLGPLYLGSRVTLLSDQAEKGFVPLASGGWVYAAHLRPLGQWASDFVAEAERFLGAPYQWGGRSVAGIDCSGLLQMALAACGLDIARDTDQQATTVGQPRAIDSPRSRGDIVFFPGHVGIMLDDRRLLHANATHMAVTVNPLTEVIAIVAATSPTPLTAIRRID